VISLPKVWQDFDAKKDDTYRIDPRIFDTEYNNYFKNTNRNKSSIDNDNGEDNDDNDGNLSTTSSSWSYDTIVDNDKLDPKDLHVSFDLDLYYDNHIVGKKKEESDDNTTTSNSIVHVHLNRDGSEITNRALKRLEISIMKKILTSGTTTAINNNNKKKKKQKKITHGVTTTTCTFSKSFTCTSTVIATATATKNVDSNNNNNTIHRSGSKTKSSGGGGAGTTTTTILLPINTDELSTIELSKKLAVLFTHQHNSYSQQQKDHTTPSTTTTTTTLELSVPSVSNNNDRNKNDDASYNNTVLPNNSNSNSNSNTTTTTDISFQLKVISNPPVILATRTFESFRSKLFIGIPIVIQTILLHSSRAEVSWFVGNNNNTTHDNEKELACELEYELVLHNNHAFIPQPYHVGKTLCVVIRPVRDGYDDDDHDTYDTCSSSSSSSSRCFQEAYQFKNLIEELPSMPIISPLRNEFITTTAAATATKLSSSSSPMIVRMCTYNILADLYVSRRQQQQLNAVGSSSTSTTTKSTTLLYPHVTNYDHIKKNRRIPMIVGELIAYNPGIICLQEVDKSVYDAYLEPVFKTLNYDGYYSNKKSCQREGCAMFWSNTMFDLAVYDNNNKALVSAAEVFNVSDLFQSGDDININHDDDDEKKKKKKKNRTSNNDNFVKDDTQTTKWDSSMEEISQLLESHNELRKIIMEKLGQVVQIATLKLKYNKNTNKNYQQINEKERLEKGQPSNNMIVVANTHLFYHPLADHIRAMQVFVILKKIDEVRHRRCSNSNGNGNGNGNSSARCTFSTNLDEEVDDNTVHSPYPFMFCGDLNSDPLSGASQLLYTRSLAPDHHDCWKYLYKYQWDYDDGNDNDGMIIEHDKSKYRNNNDTTTTTVDVTTIERNDTTEHPSSDKIMIQTAEKLESSTDTTTTTTTPCRHPIPPFIKLPDSFPILQSGCKEMPKFTNYAPGFIDTLDYIFGSQASKNDIYGFLPKNSAPMPSIEDVKKFVAMVSGGSLFLSL